MPLGTEVGLGPDDIVLDGNPAPLPKKGQNPLPQFSAHVYCGNVGHIHRRDLYSAARPSRRNVFTARRSYVSAVLGVVILSVRPVCPTVTHVFCD